MSNARRDGNFVPAMQGVSSVDRKTPTDVWVNPTTHAVLIDSTSLFSGLDSRYLQLSGGTLTGDLVMQDAATPAKSYRFRTSGSALDFDAAGNSIYLSVYDNADFTGTQRQYMIFGHLYDYVTCFRNWEWKDSSSNVQAQINPNGGFVFNEGGTSNLDFRVESDTEANMLLLDADGNTNGTLYIGGNSLTTAHSSRKGGLFFPVQAPTASAPTYVIGAIYFDTTLNKLRIGGAAGWETVTSV